MKNDEEKYVIDGIIDPDNHKDIVIGVYLASTGGCSIDRKTDYVSESLMKLSKLLYQKNRDNEEIPKGLRMALITVEDNCDCKDDIKDVLKALEEEYDGEDEDY